MSIALTDLLIKLFEPKEVLKFQKDPTEYLSKTQLSFDEKRALLENDRAKLRLYARVKELSDPLQQFNRPFMNGNHMELVVHELHVELQVHATEQVAIAGQGTLFVDKAGCFYRSQAIEA